jgi:hypothetical protein
MLNWEHQGGQWGAPVLPQTTNAMLVAWTALAFSDGKEVTGRIL